MEKYIVIIRKVVCFTCLFALFLSCESTAEAPPKPKVIRKKIIAQTDKKPQIHNTKPAASKRNSQRSPLKTDRKVSKPQTAPVQKPTAPDKTLLAEKTKSVESQKSASDPANEKKSAVRPKSDITVPKTATKVYTTQTGDTVKTDSKPKTGDQLPVASTAPADKRDTPPGSPPLYDPKGKVDPFEPLFKEKAVAKAKDQPRKRIPRTPLEKIDISQLKLVGIVMAKSGNRALVEESSGKGYVITQGTYIGTSGGKVAQIQKDKVIVEEEFVDVYGKDKKRKKELTLPKPPGEL